MGAFSVIGGLKIGEYDKLFQWYDNVHHSGIAMLTPVNAHYSTHSQILNDSTITLTDAYMNKLERFFESRPRIRPLPEQVWINKPILQEIPFSILSLVLKINMPLLLTRIVNP